METLIIILLAAVALLGIIIVANLAMRFSDKPLVRYVTPVLLMCVNGYLVFNGLVYLLLSGSSGSSGSNEAAALGMSSVSPSQASNVALLSLLMATIASALLVPQVRRWLKRTALLAPSFNPDSTMHTLGLIFSVYLVGQTAMSFALLNDMGELAEDFSASPLVGVAVLQAVLFYALAIMGVGFIIRRDWRATLKRLGLVWPEWWHVMLALGIALAMVVVQFCTMALWLASIGEEAFNEQNQAAEAMTGTIDTIGVAFLLSFTSSTSEEIAFRGALQPVLGIGFTSIVFAVTHVQYGISPATLLILALGVVLGLLRKHFNTSTAILCHFFYNFALMGLSVYLQRWAELLPDPTSTSDLPQAFILIGRQVLALLGVGT